MPVTFTSYNRPTFPIENDTTGNIAPAAYSSTQPSTTSAYPNNNNNKNDTWLNGHFETLMLCLVLFMLVALVAIFFGVIVCRHFECCFFRKKYRGSKRALRSALRRRDREEERRQRGVLPPEEVLWRVNRIRGASTMSTTGDTKPFNQASSISDAQRPMLDVSDRARRSAEDGFAEETIAIEMQLLEGKESRTSGHNRNHPSIVRDSRPWWKFWAPKTDNSSSSEDEEDDDQSDPLDLGTSQQSNTTKVATRNRHPSNDERGATYGDATGNFRTSDEVHPRVGPVVQEKEGVLHPVINSVQYEITPPTPPPITDGASAGWSSNLAAYLRHSTADNSRPPAPCHHPVAPRCGHYLPNAPTALHYLVDVTRYPSDSLLLRQSLQEDESFREPQQPVLAAGHRFPHASLTRSDPRVTHQNGANIIGYGSSSDRDDEEDVRSVGSEEADLYHKGNILFPPHLLRRDANLPPAAPQPHHSTAKRNSAVSLYGPSADTPSPSQMVFDSSFSPQNKFNPASFAPLMSAPTQQCELQRGVVLCEADNDGNIKGSIMSAFGIPTRPHNSNLVELWADEQVMRGIVRTPTQSFLAAAARASSGGGGRASSGGSAVLGKSLIGNQLGDFSASSIPKDQASEASSKGSSSFFDDEEGS